LIISGWIDGTRTWRTRIKIDFGVILAALMAAVRVDIIINQFDATFYLAA
jgi:hypothetical protein